MERNFRRRYANRRLIARVASALLLPLRSPASPAAGGRRKMSLDVPSYATSALPSRPPGFPGDTEVVASMNCRPSCPFLLDKPPTFTLTTYSYVFSDSRNG